MCNIITAHLPWVDNHLLGLVCIQGEIVIMTPGHKFLHLSSVRRLSPTKDDSNYRNIICVCLYVSSTDINRDAVIISSRLAALCFLDVGGMRLYYFYQYVLRIQLWCHLNSRKVRISLYGKS